MLIILFVARARHISQAFSGNSFKMLGENKITCRSSSYMPENIRKFVNIQQIPYFPFIVRGFFCCLLLLYGTTTSRDFPPVFCIDGVLLSRSRVVPNSQRGYIPCHPPSLFFCGPCSSAIIIHLVVSPKICTSSDL